MLSIGSGTNPPKEIGKINVQKSTLNPKTWMNFFDVVGSAVCYIHQSIVTSLLVQWFILDDYTTYGRTSGQYELKPACYVIDNVERDRVFYEAGTSMRAKPRGE